MMIMIIINKYYNTHIYNSNNNIQNSNNCNNNYANNIKY